MWRQQSMKANKSSQMWKQLDLVQIKLQLPGLSPIYISSRFKNLFIDSRKWSFSIKMVPFEWFVYLSPVQLNRCWTLLSRTLLWTHVWCSAFTSLCLQTAEEEAVSELCGSENKSKGTQWHRGRNNNECCAAVLCDPSVNKERDGVVCVCVCAWSA